MTLQSQPHLELTGRVALLERRLKWQSSILCLMLLVSFIVVLSGADRPRLLEVRAHRFVVTDNKDVARGVMTSHEGITMFALYDDQGHTRVRLRVLEDGHPEVALLDADGKSRIRVTERAGAVRLSMLDGNGLGQITVGQTEDAFGVDLTSQAGSSSLRLRAGDVQPQISLQGVNGSLVQAFALADTTGISLSNTVGQPSIIMSLLNNLRPMILLQNDEKRSVLVPEATTQKAAAAPAGQPTNRQ